MLHPYTYEDKDQGCWYALLEDPAFGPQSDKYSGYTECDALQQLITAFPENFEWQLKESQTGDSYWEVRRECSSHAEAEAMKQILGTICGRPIKGSLILTVAIDDEDEAAMELDEYNLHLRDDT